MTPKPAKHIKTTATGGIEDAFDTADEGDHDTRKSVMLSWNPVNARKEWVEL